MRSKLVMLIAACAGLYLVLPSDPVAAGEEPKQNARPSKAAAVQQAKKMEERLADLYQRAKLAEAVPLAQELLQLQERTHGADSEPVGDAANILGLLLHRQNKLDAAQSHFERALKIYTRVLGDKHSAVAVVLDNMAGVLSSRGHYAKSLALGKRALALLNKSLGSDHISVAVSSHNLAQRLYLRGRYAEAKPLFELALATHAKVHGNDHPSVARISSNLAFALKALGDNREAQRLWSRSLEVCERSLGPDHPAVATALTGLASLHEIRGQLAEAQPLAERALAIRRKSLGPEHPETVASTRELGSLLLLRGDHAGARRQLQQALAIHRRVLGSEHPAVANSLLALARLEMALANGGRAKPLVEEAARIVEERHGPDHSMAAAILDLRADLIAAPLGSEAESRLLERSLAIRTKAYGEDAPGVVTSLRKLASLRYRQGLVEDSRRLYVRALAVRTAAFGAGHQNTASSQHDLAGLLPGAGEFGESERLYRAALATRERVFSADHHITADTLSDLAVLVRQRGAMRESRDLTERALRIRERVFGKNHPTVALSVNNLAVLLGSLGSQGEARRLHERAIAIWESTFGRDSLHVATGLHNYASWVRSVGARDHAMKLAERALAIRERLLGRTHPETALSAQLMGQLLQDAGAFAEARTYLERTVAIRDEVLGAAHPSTAVGRHNLAAVLLQLGEHTRARDLFTGSIAVQEQIRVSDHPALSAAYGSRAWTHLALGEAAPAEADFRKALDLAESHALRLLGARGGGRRVAGTQAARNQLDAWLSACESLGHTGYAEVLRLKGLTARVAEREQSLLRGGDTQVAAVLRELESVDRKLATITNAFPGPTASAASRTLWRAEYGKAAAECERLRLAVGKRFPTERDAAHARDVPALQARLPRGTALLDFLRTSDTYVVWVVTRAGSETRVALGPAAEIDTAAQTFVDSVSDPGAKDWGKDSRALGALIVNRIAGHLPSGVRRLIVSPDSVLSSVPFGLLPGTEAGRFLGEQFQVVRATSAHRLMAQAERSTAGVGALLLGGVDFGKAPAPSRARRHADRQRRSRFATLPATRVEIAELAAQLGKNSTKLTGMDASEASLREHVQGRRVVHLATHGYAQADRLAALRRLRPAADWSTSTEERHLASPTDPMTLFGLALAGANNAGTGGDDGLLSALEASHLDLRATELVVLSACDTAGGVAENGEGVSGLVGAFQLAGAQQVIASLWRVDDEATRRLMSAFYRAWVPRGGKPAHAATALREAQSVVRKDPKWAHPYYWSPWVIYVSSD